MIYFPKNRDEYLMKLLLITQGTKLPREKIMQGLSIGKQNFCNKIYVGISAHLAITPQPTVSAPWKKMFPDNNLLSAA